jgi:hypothetical protein
MKKASKLEEKKRERGSESEKSMKMFPLLSRIFFFIFASFRRRGKCNFHLNLKMKETERKLHEIIFSVMPFGISGEWLKMEIAYCHVNI